MSCRRSRSGGQVDGEHIDSVVQVFTKSTRLHVFAQVSVGRAMIRTRTYARDANQFAASIRPQALVVAWVEALREVLQVRR